MNDPAIDYEESPRRRTKGKLAVLCLLLAALGFVGMLAYQYATTKKPLGEIGALPWVPSGVAKKPPHYLYSIYGLGRPMGVARSGDQVFITDLGEQKAVLVFDSDGKLVNTLAPPGVTDWMPVYVATDRDGNVYVSDRLRATIDIFGADGSYRGGFLEFGVPEEEWQPLALAFDREGNLYVSLIAPGAHQIAVFSPDGLLKVRFGKEGSQPGQFWFPNGLAVDDRGNIYVADSNNGRVQAFGAEGNLMFVIGRGSDEGGLSMPRGIAVDGQNRLFVVDTVAYEVKVFDVSRARPRLLYTFGAGGIGDGQFFFPNGLTLDSSSRIYVTDRENARVQVWGY